MLGKKPRRFRSETFRILLPGGNEAQHEFDVSLAYRPDGTINDVIFVGRGKIGHGLDLMFNELGIQLSRIIQGRDPTEEETYGNSQDQDQLPLPLGGDGRRG